MLKSALLLILSFFFNNTPTTKIYTLSLHDALPIYAPFAACSPRNVPTATKRELPVGLTSPLDITRTPSKLVMRDRKSTRLNSSHTVISYAVFCLKKKKQQENK